MITYAELEFMRLMLVEVSLELTLHSRNPYHRTPMRANIMLERVKAIIEREIDESQGIPRPTADG